MQFPSSLLCSVVLLVSISCVWIIPSLNVNVDQLLLTDRQAFIHALKVALPSSDTHLNKTKHYVFSHFRIWVIHIRQQKRFEHFFLNLNKGGLLRGFHQFGSQFQNYGQVYATLLLGVINAQLQDGLTDASVERRLTQFQRHSE